MSPQDAHANTGGRMAFDAIHAEPGELRRIEGVLYRCVVMPMPVAPGEDETRLRWPLAGKLTYRERHQGKSA